MTLAILVYLASLIGSLLHFFVIVSIICFVMTVISMIAMAESENIPSEQELWRKRRNLSFWLGMICVVFAMVLPSKKTMYIMAGAYAAQKVYESPEAARISSKVIAIVEKQLDDILIENVGGKK